MESSPTVLSLFSTPARAHDPFTGSQSRPDVLLRSFVGEPPPHLWPTQEARRLAAALVWGSDHLLDLQEVEPGRRLTIGADPSATMQVFHEVTRLGPLPVLEPQQDGTFRVFLPAGATARLRKNGEELTIVELLERGLAEPIHSPVEGAVCTLELHDRAVLHFGNVRLIARYLRPAVPKRPSPYTAAFWSRVTIYLMAAFTLYRMISITDWEDTYSASAYAAGQADEW